MAVQRSNINQPNNSMPERTTRTLINSLAKLLRCQKSRVSATTWGMPFKVSHRDRFQLWRNTRENLKITMLFSRRQVLTSTSTDFDFKLDFLLRRLLKQNWFMPVTRRTVQPIAVVVAAKSVPVPIPSCLLLCAPPRHRLLLHDEIPSPEWTTISSTCRHTSQAAGSHKYTGRKQHKI